MSSTRRYGHFATGEKSTAGIPYYAAVSLSASQAKEKALEAKNIAMKKGKEAYEAAQKKAKELSKVAQEKGCCIIQ